ncbi:hypothetical protein Hanom_Chr08g00747881 [Helianthus anomalus]
MHMKCLLKCMNENLFPYISFFILFIVDYLEPKNSHMDNLARNTLSSMQIAGLVAHNQLSRKRPLQSEKLGEMFTLCLHGSGVALRRSNVGG